MIDQVNGILEQFKNEITRFYPDDFGSGMLHLDADSQVGVTIKHRIASKFINPINAVPQRELVDACFSNWIEYDQGLRSEPHMWSEKYVLYNARVRLHEWLRNFSLDFRNIEITPGETFLTAHGKTSIVEKLSSKKHWTITAECVDDFARLCYNNLWLKRVARSFFQRRSHESEKRLYLKFAEFKDAGFRTFRYKLLTDVLTIVRGSRSSTAPKNCTAVRFINVEPLCDLILQRCAALELRGTLESLGNSLETGQADHKDLISDSSYSTIDFSNASDSVVNSLIAFFFPAKVSKKLAQYRSPMVLIDGDFYIPNKLSSMGNGFTFEVMTILLLAIARTLDDTARVYGDDVIIHSMVAEQFVAACFDICFRVNPKKTFIHSKFRESCGAFYHDDVGYITSFDFKWCETHSDVIISCNKLLCIAQENTNRHVKGMALKAYRACLAVEGLSMYLGPNLCDQRDRIGLDKFIFAQPQIFERSVNKVLKRMEKRFHCKFYCVYTTTYHNDLVTPFSIDNIDLGTAAAFFYSGMPVMNKNRNKGRWVNSRLVVSESGATFTWKDCLSLTSEVVPLPSHTPLSVTEWVYRHNYMC